MKKHGVPHCPRQRPRAEPAMKLTALDQLVRATLETWQGLHDWLSALEVTPERVAPLIEVAQDVPEVLRVPLLHHHLRRAPGDIPLVLRLLFFGDRVESSDLLTAFGNERLEWLKQTGLASGEGST